MRLRHYELTAQGLQQEAVQEANALASTAEQQMQQALVDLDGAVKYVVSGEDQHPNRIDICNTSNAVGQYIPNDNTSSQPSAFARLPAPTSSRPANDLLTRALAEQSNPVTGRNRDQQKNSFGNLTHFSTGTTTGQDSIFGSSPQHHQSAPLFGVQQPSTMSHVSINNTELQVRSNPFVKESPMSSKNSTNTKAFQINPFSQSTIHGPSHLDRLSHQTIGRKNASGKLVSWKGRSVTYIRNEPYFRRTDTALEKVWFPDPPNFNKEQDLPSEGYDEKLEDDYRYMKDNGIFKNDIMPDLPPKREWCNWEF